MPRRAPRAPAEALFRGNQMTGFGNYISAIIYDAVEVLKDNS